MQLVLGTKLKQATFYGAPDILKNVGKQDLQKGNKNNQQKNKQTNKTYVTF